MARSREVSVAESRVPVARTPIAPSVVTKPSSATMRRKAGSRVRRSRTWVRRSQGAPGVACRLHCGSKGVRTTRRPEARAARKAEGGCEGSQEPALGAAKPGGAGSCVQAPLRFEGVADDSEAGSACRAQDGSEDSWEHMGVLVGVDVGQMQAAILKEVDLGSSLRRDFFKKAFRGE